ncbi:Hypothetical predicted protein [Cloeon dipterum]|uniref:AAA+ ATPase domain-containing protein n=1 Tax=Cloeon dipterum TaxID=197152 RepID=A0A8S1DS14_9INSE|nr:Hypothetical predicted protein [Cloeon dipterum]
MLWLLGAVTLGAAAFKILPNKKKEISWTEFVDSYLDKDLVKEVQVVNKEWVRVLTSCPENEVVWFGIGSLRSFESRVSKLEEQRNISLPITHKSEMRLMNTLLQIFELILRFVPAVLLTSALVFFFFGWPRLSTNHAFQKESDTSAAPKGAIIGGEVDISLNFTDIVGCDQAKIEVMELVNFLRYPEIYTAMGAKIPRGALLYGPPGTGKTILAKAAAAEANVTFIAMSGPEFKEIYIGIGPKRVRQLFLFARKNSPSIIFIDEIDSIAKKRMKASSVGGGSDEGENTLNQLLIEMDGFKAKERVIILAATNRLDSLDPAIMRPGRFDRLVNVPAPNQKGRTDLFEKYLKPIHLDIAIKRSEIAEELAKLTPGFTGAAIAGVCNDAAVLATRNNQCSVERENLYEAIDRAQVGMGQAQLDLSPEELKVVAYHEAGHVVTAWFLQHADPLVKVTIKARGDSLGHTQFRPRSLQLHTEEQLFHRMCVLLGGRVAEQITFGVMSTGATSDLQVVTKLAYGTVAHLGMNKKVGPLSFGGERKPLSEEMSKMIDAEVHKLVTRALKTTTDLLSSHKKDLKLIAETLLKVDTLSAGEVGELIGPRPFLQ